MRARAALFPLLVLMSAAACVRDEARAPEPTLSLGSTIATSGAHSLVVREDGTLWAWGANDAGQLGDGTTEARVTPVQIGSGYQFVAATQLWFGGVCTAFTMAVKSDGSLWTWGASPLLAVAALEPVAVGSGFASVSAHGAGPAFACTGGPWCGFSCGTSSWGQFRVVAVRLDGTLWEWGHASSWAQVGTGFVSASAGPANAVALKADGTLWAWGRNDRGLVGDGTSENRETPVQVGEGYVAASAGHYETVALKTDGTLWASGVLGCAPQFEPVRMDSGIVAISQGSSARFAVTVDGTLQEFGFLPDGTRWVREVGLPGEARFVEVATGDGVALLVKSDGTVWEWHGFPDAMHEVAFEE